MKLTKHLGRTLLFAGFGLLSFYVAARIHEGVLSRASIRRFEELKKSSSNKSTKEHRIFQPSASTPDFVSWSEERIRHYEESLNERVARPLAVIHIDRIRVEAPVFEGTDDLTLNRGVGHISGTTRVGESGNVAIAGHRDGFFRGLKDIKVGDRIALEEPDRTETYIVDQLDIVAPNNLSVLRSGAKPALTLVTCYPFYYVGGAPQRFIVHAKPASSDSPRTNDFAGQADQESSTTNLKPSL